MRTIRGQECVVAVIGGAGFLGSHLTDLLIEDRGCKVVVMDNLCAGRREFVHKDAAFEHIDITGSENAIYQCFKRHKVNYVMNYAAEPYVPTSYERPLHVFQVNAMGALQVINAAQDAGCEAILQVSSAEIYGEGYRGDSTDEDGHPDGNIDEFDDVCPHSSYGAAKAAIDAMCQVRWKEAKTPVIALRQFNCCGERDVTHPYVIVEIAFQLHKNGPKVKLGNNSFRDFLYAGDAVRMAVELLEKGQFGEVFNLGSEEGVKIYDLAQVVGKAMGFNRVEVETDKTRVRPWEIWHLLASNEKIYSVIESRPTVKLQEAVQRTVNYFESINWRLEWWESTQRRSGAK